MNNWTNSQTQFISSEVVRRTLGNGIMDFYKSRRLRKLMQLNKGVPIGGTTKGGLRYGLKDEGKGFSQSFDASAGKWYKGKGVLKDIKTTIRNVDIIKGEASAYAVNPNEVANFISGKLTDVQAEFIADELTPRARTQVERAYTQLQRKLLTGFTNTIVIDYTAIADEEDTKKRSVSVTALAKADKLLTINRANFDRKAVLAPTLKEMLNTGAGTSFHSSLISDELIMQNALGIPMKGIQRYQGFHIGPTTNIVDYIDIPANAPTAGTITIKSFTAGGVAGIDRAVLTGFTAGFKLVAGMSIKVAGVKSINGMREGTIEREFIIKESQTLTGADADIELVYSGADNLDADTNSETQNVSKLPTAGDIVSFVIQKAGVYEVSYGSDTEAVEWGSADTKLGMPDIPLEVNFVEELKKMPEFKNFNDSALQLTLRMKTESENLNGEFGVNAFLDCQFGSEVVKPEAGVRILTKIA